jgi:hypothetical protein
VLGKLGVGRLSLYRVLDRCRSWSIPGMLVVSWAYNTCRCRHTTAVAADFEAILRCRETGV